MVRKITLNGKSEPIEIHFKFNSLGELTELTLPDTSGQKNQLFCNYDLNGNEIARTSNLGFIYKQKYNEMDLPIQQRAGHEPKIFDKNTLRATGIDEPTFAQLNKHYHYDNGLNTIKINDNNQQLTFYLNRNNQITSVNNKGDPSEIYTYDNCGYITQQKQSPLGNLFDKQHQDEHRYILNSDIYQKGNKLNRLENNYYTYDNAGRLINKTEIKHGFRNKETHYRWNGNHQLIGLTNYKGEVWHYKYDSLGRRIAKQCPEKRINIEYLWDGEQIAYTITEKNGKLESERHSIFNGWELIAQQDYYSEFKQTTEGNITEWKFETHYAITQPNGKILALFNPEGKIAWRPESQTIWGLSLSNYSPQQPLNPNLLFSGQYFDEESGLAYNRFRYYDPETANYISSDPIGLNGGETPYAYVFNPLDWIDPFGLAGRALTSKKAQIKNNQLPTKGKIRYIPSKDWKASTPLPKKDRGYIDKFGNIWKKGPSRTRGEPFEWDVQLSKIGKDKIGWLTRDGSHANVSLTGRITHK